MASGHHPRFLIVLLFLATRPAAARLAPAMASRVLTREGDGTAGETVAGEAGGRDGAVGMARGGSGPRPAGLPARTAMSGACRTMRTLSMDPR